jgi:tellurite resistance protein TerC
LPLHGVNMIESVGTPTLYLSFTAFVVVMLAIDFFGLRTSGDHKVGTKEAAIWSLIWISVALAFGGWFYWYLEGIAGPVVAKAKSLEYLTGYLIEKSLAVDNVFVWITLFGFFGVPPQYQKRVLLYGVLGAIVLRAILIYLGAILLAQFHWILYIFGLFLLYTGIQMLISADSEPDLADNKVLKWLRGHMRITDEYHGEKFFIMRDGLRFATPMFVVLIMVEITDVIFAVDSIPAIFAVTSDPFIVFTSNVFAILGLRAMYFLLADMADRFHLLKYGLAGILIFIGVKMLLLDIYKIPTGIALGVVGVILAGSVVASLLTSKPAPKTPPG